MMCAIMNKLRAIKAAPRHRPVFDLRMPVLLKPGTLIAAVAPRETPMAFNSWLMQPLFTRFSLLFQSADDKHYDSTLRVPNPRIIGGTNTMLKIILTAFMLPLLFLGTSPR